MALNALDGVPRCRIGRRSSARTWIEQNEFSKNPSSHLNLSSSSSEPQLFIFSNFSLEHPKLLSTVTHQAFLRIPFQNRRNVRPAVIFLLDRTEFGSELTKWKLLSEPEGRTLLEVEPKSCIWEYTAIQMVVRHLKRC
ncbi:uncharacterized protein LOC128197817 [Vigna angularis]|uniref:uncharacterized protein LOC128197817 n=1 Tax=Phaseolus angularis TaxID=3914 RepID=UPI0022B35552|nr:uncharacterized protein LOC128197817 [Vigna angularis]